MNNSTPPTIVTRSVSSLIPYIRKDSRLEEHIELRLSIRPHELVRVESH